MSKRQDPKNKATPKRKATKPAVVGIDPVKLETTERAAGSKNNALGLQPKTGRPSKYTPELVEEITERLSKGEPLAQICREEGMPSVTTMWQWEKDIEGVSERVARARKVGHDAIAIDCLNIADDNGRDMRVLASGVEVLDSDHVQRAKLRIDTRLKLLACWDPKRYGNKLDMTNNGEAFPAPVIRLHAGPEQEAD